MMEETAFVYSHTGRTRDAVKLMEMALELRSEYLGVDACRRSKTEYMYDYVKARRQEKVLEMSRSVAKILALELIAVLLVWGIVWWRGWI
jgi:hypothetical protein